MQASRHTVGHTYLTEQNRGQLADMAVMSSSCRHSHILHEAAIRQRQVRLSECRLGQLPPL